MGFSRRRVQEALRTVGSGLERALSWLIDGQASSEGSVNGSTEGEGEERELSEVGRARKAPRYSNGRGSNHRGTRAVGSPSDDNLPSVCVTPPASPAGARPSGTPPPAPDTSPPP